MDPTKAWEEHPLPFLGAYDEDYDFGTANLHNNGARNPFYSASLWQ